jgi:transcription termination/antitermination protein NusG
MQRTPPEDEGIGLLTGPPSTSAPSAAAPAAPAAAVVAPPAPEAPSPGPARPAGLLSLKAADEPERFVTAGTISTLSAVLTSGHNEPGMANLAIEIAYASKYPGEGAEWPVAWMAPGKRSFSAIVATKLKTTIPLTPGVGVPITFQVEAPVGIRFGDRFEIRLAVRWEDETKTGASLTLACIGRQAVLAIKSSRGYEREVADTLLARAEEKPDVVFSLLVPAALRGYVFAEGMSAEGVREMLKGIRKARGLVDGETTLHEVEPLLVPRVTVEGFVEGAIVELIAGPFKGEKARVRKIDQGKEEITVELIEAVVPIPVTVRGDHVRMLEKGGGKSGG